MSIKCYEVGPVLSGAAAHGGIVYLVECSRNWFDGDRTGLKRRTLNSRISMSLRERLEQLRDRTEAAYQK